MTSTLRRDELQLKMEETMEALQRGNRMLTNAGMHLATAGSLPIGTHDQATKVGHLCDTLRHELRQMEMQLIIIANGP